MYYIISQKRIVHTIVLMMVASFNLLAHSQTSACSNATFNGRYVFEADGKNITLDLLGLVTLEQSLETVGYVTLDGNGNVTDSNVAIEVDGKLTTNVDTGTYSVNPDCTGTVTLNDPTEPLTFTVVAQDPDPTTSIANDFAGQIDANGLDLDITEANLDPPGGTPLTCQQNVAVRVNFVGGTLKGGTGSETDSAFVLLLLAGRANSTASPGTVEMQITEKINGTRQNKLTLNGTYALSSNCTLLGSVSDSNGHQYFFQGQVAELIPGSTATNTIALDKGKLLVSTGTRGYSGSFVFANPSGGSQ